MPFSHDVTTISFQKIKGYIKIVFNLRYFEIDQSAVQIGPDILNRDIPATYNPNEETPNELLARVLDEMQTQIDIKKQFASQLEQAESYLSANLQD